MESISCIILAGGESSRMGEDKGLKLFKSKALVSYSLELAKQMSNIIYICTNNVQYQQFGFPLIPDRIIKKGPLGGLYSGLSASKTDWNLILPCDTPFLESSLLKEMLIQLNDNQIVVPKSENGTIQPLIGFYHQSVIPIVHAHLISDRLKILGLLNEVKTHYVIQNESNRKFFSNINTPEDLQNYEY